METGRAWSESDNLMHYVNELRKAKCYRFSAPSLLVWARQDGKPQRGQGVTRDLSTFGVYIPKIALPQVGAHVQIDIAHTEMVDSSNRLQLHGESVVLRSEPHDVSEGGLAASARFYPETTALVSSRLELPG